MRKPVLPRATTLEGILGNDTVSYVAYPPVSKRRRLQTGDKMQTEGKADQGLKADFLSVYRVTSITEC